MSNDNKKISDVNGDFHTALILAGGKSSRMGQDKALLPLGDMTVIEFLLGRLRSVCKEVIIVARPEQSFAHLDARVVFDVIPGKFSLGGLYTGLLQSPSEANFVCACDMPLLAPPVVNFLFEQLADYDAVVPQIGGQIEPLCAIYTKSCLSAIRRRLLDNDLRMSGWLGDVRTRFVDEPDLRKYDPHLRTFFNLNSATDYARLLSLMEES